MDLFSEKEEIVTSIEHFLKIRDWIVQERIDNILTFRRSDETLVVEVVTDLEDVRNIKENLTELIQKMEGNYFYVATPDKFYGLLNLYLIRTMGIGLFLVYDNSFVHESIRPKRKISLAKMREKTLRDHTYLEKQISELTRQMSNLMEKINLLIESKEERKEKISSPIIYGTEEKNKLNLEIMKLKSQISSLKREIETLKKELMRKATENLVKEEGVTSSKKEFLKREVEERTQKEVNREDFNWEKWIKNPEIPDFAQSNPWMEILKKKKNET